MRTEIVFPVHTAIGTEDITPLPGNSDIAVSHSVEIFPQFRNQGLGKKAHEARLNRLTNLGYEAVICTVRDDNEAQKKILFRNGWTLAYSFHNKDGDKIHLAIKTLQTQP